MRACPRDTRHPKHNSTERRPQHKSYVYVACSFAASISVRHSVVETVASIGLLLLVADVDSTIELRMDTRKLLHRRRRALLGLKKPGVARPLKGSHRGFA